MSALKQPRYTRSLHQDDGTRVVDKKLLEILCCPVSRRPLLPFAGERLKRVNEAIERGQVSYVDGEAVGETLTEALITDDDKVIYAVRDGIAVLLPDRGIGTTQFENL